MPDAAFDGLAPTYDDTFTDTIIGRYLRDQIHNRLEKHFTTGDTVLEIGCGTGEDAVYLAQHGINILATDVSSSMLAVAQQKASALSIDGKLNFQHLDITNLPENEFTQVFDGVFSNFGALNVLSEWQTLASWLASCVRPGGIVAFGVMSPRCIWEPLWHGLHGDFVTATRRWKKSVPFENIDITYPTIQRLKTDFMPHFTMTHVQGLGLFLPPSDVFGAIEKRQTLLNLLMSLEKQFTTITTLAPFADHYWIEFQRNNV